jgi:hypothetical protein
VREEDGVEERNGWGVSDEVTYTEVASDLCDRVFRRWSADSAAPLVEGVDVDQALTLRRLPIIDRTVTQYPRLDPELLLPSARAHRGPYAAVRAPVLDHENDGDMAELTMSPLRLALSAVFVFATLFASAAWGLAVPLDVDRHVAAHASSLTGSIAAHARSAMR